MTADSGAMIVTLRHVTREYGAAPNLVRAVDDISLSVERGGFVSLFGPSGSGESTLLNLIGALDRPTNGEIELDGQRLDLLSRDELAQIRLNKIGFIFQAYNLVPVLSAVENVEFVMQLGGVPQGQCRSRAMELLAEVGLAGLEHRRPGELSGGQQQRVAVARAIVDNPALVLADEPTANLDSASAHNLLELMRDLNRSHGVTFIFSTHDKLVMESARRLIELKDGKIISDSCQASH